MEMEPYPTHGMHVGHTEQVLHLALANKMWKSRDFQAELEEDFCSHFPASLLWDVPVKMRGLETCNNRPHEKNEAQPESPTVRPTSEALSHCSALISSKLGAEQISYIQPKLLIYRIRSQCSCECDGLS